MTLYCHKITNINLMVALEEESQDPQSYQDSPSGGRGCGVYWICTLITVTDIHTALSVCV